MIVRGTAKTLTLLGVRRPVEVSPGADDWYVNLLWLDRRKCLLVVHATTLFPVFVPNVHKPELTPLGDWLVRAVRPELAVELVPVDGLGALAPADLVVTKTASRKVLGYLTEMAFHIEHVTALRGGLARLDVDEINHDLRRVLHSMGGHQDYATPLDLVAERLAGEPPRPWLAPAVTG